MSMEGPIISWSTGLQIILAIGEGTDSFSYGKNMVTWKKKHTNHSGRPEENRRSMVNFSCLHGLYVLHVSMNFYPCNVVSWLVSRFAIVAKIVQTSQGPSNVCKVHYCGKNSWETILFVQKNMFVKKTNMFSEKILLVSLSQRIRPLIKPLRKNRFSTNFQGTGPWEGPVHFSNFVLSVRNCSNFSRADSGAKRRKKSLSQKQLPSSQKPLSLSLYLSFPFSFSFSLITLFKNNLRWKR